MKGICMLLIPCFLLAGTGWYLADRLHRGLAAFFPTLRFWPVAVAVCVLLLLLAAGFVRALTPLSDNVKYALGVISACCMGLLLYLLLFTVAADVLVLPLQLLKLPFTMHRLFRGFVMLAVVLLTIGTCTYGFLHARSIEHSAYEIRLEEGQSLSDLTMVMISDLHLGAIGSESRLAAIVEEINSCQPDVVCIAGDFFDTDFAAIRDPEAALQTLRALHATYGVYACLGNHDGGQTFDRMTAFLEQAGIQLLDDAYTVIDDRLILVGRLDASAIGGYGERMRRPLSDIFNREDQSLPVVVLDHNPVHIREYDGQADLILCGHTHQGQIFPANLVTGWMYTVDHGYYRQDANSPHVVVSSGVGTWGMPMRVGTDCEIVTIRFS